MHLFGFLPLFVIKKGGAIEIKENEMKSQSQKNPK